MDNARKAAAAMSAVMTYVRQEEEAVAKHNAPVTIPADVYRQLEGLYLQLRRMFEGR